MKKCIVIATMLNVISLVLSACSSSIPKTSDKNNDIQSEHSSIPLETDETANRFPDKLVPIPDNYLTEAKQQGTLQDLYYNTYESFFYDEKSQKLQKHAVVYLPYGYNESKQYPVFYLMHGGWSNEYTYLGSSDEPHGMKHILDHGIVNGEIQPMIVVCPTYNNTSPEDSGDYSLALRLTDNYHNELINDLIPAVEGKYSTYAEDTTSEAIAASRDYRAFGGFSMGSMATWRTFEHSLDYFRYFMPSSGGPVANTETYESIIKNSGHEWDDFFVFAASGTNDFAYSGFKNGIDAMRESDSGLFCFADNEAEGNLYYLESDGNHSGEYAILYFYNGLRWIWRG